MIFRWASEAAARLVELQAGTVDGIDNPIRDIDAQHVIAFGAQKRRSGQADIAKTHHTNLAELTHKNSG